MTMSGPEVIVGYTYLDPTGKLPESVALRLDADCVTILEIPDGEFVAAIHSQDVVAVWPWEAITAFRCGECSEDPEEMDMFIVTVAGLGGKSHGTSMWP